MEKSKRSIGFCQTVFRVSLIQTINKQVATRPRFEYEELSKKMSGFAGFWSWICSVVEIGGMVGFFWISTKNEKVDIHSLYWIPKPCYIQFAYLLFLFCFALFIFLFIFCLFFNFSALCNCPDVLFSFKYLPHKSTYLGTLFHTIMCS